MSSYVVKIRESIPKSPELANVAQLAQRLMDTPDDQDGLASDRLNDLRIAIDEFERMVWVSFEAKHRQATANLWNDLQHDGTFIEGMDRAAQERAAGPFPKFVGRRPR